MVKFGVKKDDRPLLDQNCATKIEHLQKKSKSSLKSTRSQSQI